MKVTLESFAKRERNSDMRKTITLELDGEEVEVSISKVSNDQALKNSNLVQKGKMSEFFADIIQNHVFDPDSGEPIFKKIDILAEYGVTSVAQFVTEYMDNAFLRQLVSEISEFSGLKPLQEEVDLLKN